MMYKVKCFKNSEAEIAISPYNEADYFYGAEFISGDRRFLVRVGSGYFAFGGKEANLAQHPFTSIEQVLQYGHTVYAFSDFDSFCKWYLRLDAQEPKPEKTKADLWAAYENLIGRMGWMATATGIYLNKSECRRIANIIGLNTSNQEITEYLRKYEEEVSAKRADAFDLSV